MADTPRAEVRAVTIAISIAVALLAWSVYPSGGDDDAAETTLAATAAPESSTFSGGAAPSVAGAPTQAGGATAPAAAGGGSVGSGGAPGAGSSAAGGGASGGAAPAEGGGGEPAGGGGSGGAAPAPQGPLTASDVGVTATSIRIGYVPFPQEAAKAIGAPFNFREDEEEVVNAYLEEINKAGGVNGRKIEVVYRPLTGFEPNTMRAMCLQLTEQDKVFAVLQQYGGADYPCLFDHKTPFITAVPGTHEEQQRYYPYSISTQASPSDSAKDMIYGLRDQGFFDPAKGFKKLGLLSTSCEDSYWNNPQYGVKAYLRQVGVTSWSEYKADCSLESLNSAHTPAMLQHRQDGVTHVLIAAQPTDRNYTAAAQQQGYKPVYGWGDWHWATHDANAASFNLDQMDGSIGVSQFNHGDPLAVPEVQKCNKIITDHGLPPVKTWEVDLLVLNACEHLRLFVEAATRVGPDLKRASLGLAVEQIGNFPVGVEDSAVFGPGKLTGGDTVQFIVFRKSCRCWQPSTGFRPSY